jgi:multicomponent K+:H+ antiporter subunit F
MSPLLSAAILLALSCYAIAVALTAVRLFTGPSAQDRVLALDSIYINGLLIVLTLGIRYASNMYFEVALLIALFGFVSSTAMAKFLLRGEVIE